MLSMEQAGMIEAQQTNALKNIFGFGISAAKMRRKSCLPTLAECRFNCCKKFAQVLTKNHRFMHWVPLREPTNYAQREGTNYNLYTEERAKTNRAFNSPLFYYRRILNGRATE